MQYGHFDNEKREYVIDRVDLPVSWTNYLGVKDLCVVVNHTAGGYMFYQSPEYHRVTRFRGNAVPMDRPGHYVYLRDAGDGDYWSISWQPVGKPLNQAKYTCRHGMSYTTYECDYKGIKASQTLMVPMDDAVELWDVRLKNTTDKERRISVFSYCEFSFHHIMIDNQNFQMSLYCAGSSYDENIIEYDLFYEEFGYQYFTSNVTPDGFECLRDSFLGAYRTEDNPIAVEHGTCSGSHELGNNHCGSLQKDLVLAPGEEVRLIFMLGEGNREAGKKIREKYSDMANVDAAYAQLKDYWENKFAQLQIKTPNEGMNTLINTWNLYQAEVNIMFSRFASFIEVGGRTGLGYRDTAQDAMTIPHSNPEKCRQRIVELLRGLTTKGYGLHLFSPEWFDPDAKKEKKKPFKSPTVIPTVNAKDIVHGLEDACSDDALWLVPSIIEYIKETGETGFADETVTYADGGEGTVYEHMKRILDFSAEQVGATGICKGLRADWNDCLNLGGGESAMVSFLHYWAICHFLQLAEYLGRTEDVEKGKRAMDSVDKYLFTPYGILLNAPSYTVPDDDIGFVTRVYPGLKENGSIFSHPNPWAWAAECVLGRGDRAMKFYNALCPYYQNNMIEIRQSEPYSYCQFVVGRDHTAFGRARHPFMTGSGGWAYFSATRYMLGIRPDFEHLTIDPCIPADWKEFSAVRRWRGAEYDIHVENPDGVMKGVQELYVDGEKVERIPVMAQGSRHDVRVVMG